jgi:hypothetical protein
MSISRAGLLAFVYAFLSLLIFSVGTSFAQDKTGATDTETKINRKKEAPKKRKPVYIVKNNTKGILYGNRCFLDVQRSMGFEYLVQPKGKPLNRSELGRNLHNFGIKFILCFRNGPFWKIKLKKKKKECRKLSGDFVG